MTRGRNIRAPRKLIRGMVAALTLLACGGMPLSALTVGAMFNIGNLAFQPTRAATDTSFAGTYFPWGLSVRGSEQLSNSVSVDSGYYRDPILRNIAYTTLTFQGDYFTVGAGPLLGVFNSTSSPLTPGVSASVRVQLPGIAFLSYGVDSTLAAPLVQTGDYIQQQSTITLGTYVPNSIISANILTKKFTEKTATGDTTDQLTEYFLETDLYQKAVPYRINLTFGYQTLSKTFINGSTTTIDQLGSIIMGTRIEIHLLKMVSLVADLKSGVYTFGQKALVGLSNPGPPNLGGYLFHLNTGLNITLQ